MNDFVKISQGINELSKRDHITFVLHFGQMDRWVATDKDDETVIINSTNSTKINIGEVVKLSETLFMKWLKLNTYVDRSVSRKADFHIKNSIENVAKILGYSDRKGLYKVLKPLYEVGLIELTEGKLGTRNLIDIKVYPYPVYSDTTICNLVKCRLWNDRKSFGFLLSKAGIEAKKNKANTRAEYKSTQETENKSTQDDVNKSTQGLVNLSTQSPVDKSPHTNESIYLIDNNISNDSNHLINNLDDKVADSLEIFLNQEQVTDDERLMMIDRLIGFEFKSLNYESHQKYFLKILKSIRSIEKSKVQKPVVKKDKLPKCLSAPNQEDQLDDDTEFEEAKRLLEQRLQKLKSKK
ncbi:hypothetical protein BKP45_05005 [Anaerobacillus alkalidiazotrophicus]|uniref:Uncharacterized protein n=1 Tax=Anaerobacillus alkalidiazotrophicus TaxID=472963 RepID=A0A1S2MB99_9BACI|nr:hypothetical protein [Anaerobacillus alkalidiazotrophicus]OIJ22038.1 hypothetical protein BKP45_05005 [Anaerobacillus alkalidiazotrophicus]